MNCRRTARPLVLVIVASLAWAPMAAAAGAVHGAAGAHGHGGAGGRPHGGAARPTHGGPGGHVFGSRGTFAAHPHGFHHLGSRHFARSFGSVAVFAAPAVIYASPSALYGSQPAPAYDPSDYYPPQMGYSQPYATTMSLTPSPAPPAPPPPPMPSVVEYPTGRYELRGDGAMTPYTWIWIPNPPPAPPSAPPMDPAAPVGSPGVRLSKLYHWTDDEGVAHWTDRRDVVPPQYREEAKPPAR